MTSEISNYIRRHEAAIAPLYKDYSQKLWDLSLSGSEEREKALVEAKERYLKVYNNSEEFRQIRQWKSSHVQTDPIEARQLKLIHDAFVPHQIKEDVLRDIVRRETEIENFFNTFRANFEGSEASDNQLRDVLRNENDITRRRASWEASKQIGHEVASQLLELIAIRNREARNLGYPDYYSMMFELQELDEKWVFSLFERLEHLSEPAFSEMKAELDATLKEKYRVTDRENYPWLYSDPFFQEFPAAGASESLDEISKDPDWLMKIGGLSEGDAKRVGASALKTLRSEMLIFLRWAITLVRFERELYRNSGQNLNSLWWKCVERVQKVTPPSNRDQPDWASKIHLASSPVYYQNYVLGELMASQLLWHIHGKVVRSGSYAG